MCRLTKVDTLTTKKRRGTSKTDDKISSIPEKSTKKGKGTSKTDKKASRIPKTKRKKDTSKADKVRKRLKKALLKRKDGTTKRSVAKPSTSSKSNQDMADPDQTPKQSDRVNTPTTVPTTPSPTPKPTIQPIALTAAQKEARKLKKKRRVERKRLRRRQALADQSSAAPDSTELPTASVESVAGSGNEIAPLRCNLRPPRHKSTFDMTATGTHARFKFNEEAEVCDEAREVEDVDTAPTTKDAEEDMAEEAFIPWVTDYTQLVQINPFPGSLATSPRGTRFVYKVHFDAISNV